MLIDPPDVLLTTPESLESMLVSTSVDHRRLFADVRAVIVDEVHAFGAGDQGWHLIAVLERLSRIAGHPLQRIGLSATVGNPAELLTWQQGSAAGQRAGVVVAPEAKTVTTTTLPTADADIQLDYVGSVSNAAKVIAALYRGEKRLVFCDSKRLVEELGA
jgi:ATP-dependent Lhr-like helicase